MKPREAHEDTRRLESPAPADPLHDESSGLIMPPGSPDMPPDHERQAWEDNDRVITAEEELDNIGERTLITGAPMGFMMDVAGDDQVEATLVTSIPTEFPDDDESTFDRSDDGPTIPRGPVLQPPAARSRSKAESPAALAAKIHAPAVSEIRKPRPSRRTPGMGAPSVLHAIVASQVSEPMPAPRPSHPTPVPQTPPMPATQLMPSAAMPSMPSQAIPSQAMPSQAMPSQAMQSQAMQSPSRGMPAAMPQGMAAMPSSQGMAAMPSSQGMVQGAPGPFGHSTPLPSQAATLPDGFAQPLSSGPGAQLPYSNDASGLPMTVPTPPGISAQPVPGVPPHLQPYLHMQGVPPGYGQPPGGNQAAPQSYPQVSPGALYQFQPPVKELSLTAQMRLFEVDELPSQYKLGASRRRWFTYIVSGVLAVVVAAVGTFMAIRWARKPAPVAASLEIDSIPTGALVWFDGVALPDRTPFVLPDVPIGKTYTIKIELSGYEPYPDKFTMTSSGYKITAPLKAVIGKLLVDSVPPNAEVWVNGVFKARTPNQIPIEDTDAVTRVEFRLKDYQTKVLGKKDLQWTAEGRAIIKVVLSH